jgi:serine/threonine-protein kinase
MGTPRLVSPEQAAGEATDGRSDLYSLGVTAFFALTGRYPFEGDNAGQLLAQHLTLPAPPVASLRAGVAPALAVAVDRCLAKDPASRFASGEDLAAALTDVRGSSPVPRVLQQLVREISSLGVDLVSFGTLVTIAVATQMLAVDFLGFGLFYTVGLAAVLASVAAIRGFSLARLTREASQEGWDQADLLSAAEREAREELSRRGPSAPLWRHTLLFAAGLGALLLLWLGPKEWAQGSLGSPLTWLVEFVSLALPVALGRWFGARLEAPREGRPGLLSQFFLLVKSEWFFRLFGGKGRPREAPALQNQPTEVLLAGQARELLHARHHAAERLGATVNALETLRLELLRARAGLGRGDGLTENLDALRRITDRIDSAIEVGDA